MVRIDAIIYTIMWVILYTIYLLNFFNIGTGFGCVVPNGYGVNYLSGEYLLRFGIESKYSSSETDSNTFRQNVVNALKDMRNICEQINGKYEEVSRL